MSIRVNLHRPTPPGKRRAQIVLDLDPDVFSRAHLSEARSALATFLDLPREEIVLLGVSRWKPILELDLPAEGAEKIAEAFSNSDESLDDALGILRLESVDLEPPPPEPPPPEPPPPEPTSSESTVEEETMPKSAPAVPEPESSPPQETLAEPAHGPPSKRSFDPFMLLPAVFVVLIFFLLWTAYRNAEQTFYLFGFGAGLALATMMFGMFFGSLVKILGGASE